MKQEIKLKIHEESDLFSPYDPDQSLLSEDVITIIQRNFIHKHRKMKEDYILHIFTDTPVDEENVKRKIRAYFQQDKDDIGYGIKRLKIKQVSLGMLGVIALAIWFALSHEEVVNVEILSIIGWVGIWEATDIFLLESPELQRVRYNLQKMIEAEIVITTI